MMKTIILMTGLLVSVSLSAPNIPNILNACHEEIMSTARLMTQSPDAVKFNETDEFLNHFDVRSMFTGPDVRCTTQTVSQLTVNRVETKEFERGAGFDKPIVDLMNDDKVTSMEAMCLSQYYMHFPNIHEEDGKIRDKCRSMNLRISSHPGAYTPLRFSLLSETGNYVDIEKTAGYVTRTIPIPSRTAMKKTFW